MPEGRPGGFPTFWQKMGQGPRPALLIHCSLAHSGAWASVMAHLGDMLTATAFDLPGHGRSGAWQGEGDFHDLSTAVARDLLGTGPVDVIGHSFGATVALRLGLEHPEKIRSLTLIEPVLFAAARGTEAAADATADHATVTAALESGDSETAAQLFMRRWGTGQKWADLPDVQRAMLAARIGLIPATDPALFGDCAGLLTPDGLEALHVPVLLIEGANSPPVIGAIHAALAARLPDARRETISGAAHMAPVTHPGAVAAAIRGMLARTEKARSS